MLYIKLFIINLNNSKKKKDWYFYAPNDISIFLKKQILAQYTSLQLLIYNHQIICNYIPAQLFVLLRKR